MPLYYNNINSKTAAVRTEQALRNQTLNGKLFEVVECSRYLELHIAVIGGTDGEVKF